jgi:hypothetical protein
VSFKVSASAYFAKPKQGGDHRTLTDYSRQVLERIADHPAKRIDELLPWNMASVRSRLDQHDSAFDTLPNASIQLMLAG